MLYKTLRITRTKLNLHKLLPYDRKKEKITFKHVQIHLNCSN